MKNQFDVSTERCRIGILHDLEILDTLPQKEFDDVAKLASIVCDAPIALISFIDHDRQWFKAKTGLSEQGTERKNAFCNHTIGQSSIFIVEDALLDERFRDNPMVTGPLKIRFYAGVPIIFNGYAMGALCIKDTRPRKLSDVQIQSLNILAEQIAIQLELRKRNQLLIEANGRIKKQQLKLRKSNHALYRLTQESISSEEEIRANLEQISNLSSSLEIRERQYRELVENASDLIYELDSTGRFSFANNIMEVRSGYTQEEITKKFYWDLVHPEDRQNVIEFYNNQRRSGLSTSYLRFRMISARGEEIWIGQNVRMIFGERNFVTQVTAISRDITALRETEMKLEKSEELYRLLSTHSRDVICLFDERLMLKFISPSVLDILGYSVHELTGEMVYLLIDPNDRYVIKRSILDLVKNRKTNTIEFRATNKDGHAIWLEANVNEVLGSKGEFLGFQADARDISSRKEIETSLRDARKKADEANMAKSQFLSMMSHEIRTPMNAIIGLTTLLIDDYPKPSQAERLGLLKFSGQNLLTIINDILDFSKIEENKIVLESVNVDLCNLVNDTVRTLEPRAQQKGIDLILKYDHNIPANILGDPVRLSQILMNLLGNAIKFTERGFVELKLSLVNQQENGDLINVSVSDSGIGIPRDKLTSVFERFSQAQADTTRKYGGTGLGLSITNSLLKLMGSQIRLDSVFGEGSTFSFDICFKPQTSILDARNSNNEQDLLPSIELLLVEDNTINQIVARGFLDQWGIKVDIANNGREAVERVRNKNYDIILMDIQMPEMDGYEACARIRSIPDERHQNVPIIALTASAMLGMRDKVLEVGMNDFISKPFSPEELYNKIVHHSKRSFMKS